MTDEDILVEFAAARHMAIDLNANRGTVKLGKRTFKNVKTALEYMQKYENTLIGFGETPFNEKVMNILNGNLGLAKSE